MPTALTIPEMADVVRAYVREHGYAKAAKTLGVATSTFLRPHDKRTVSRKVAEGLGYRVAFRNGDPQAPVLEADDLRDETRALVRACGGNLPTAALLQVSTAALSRFCMGRDLEPQPKLRTALGYSIVYVKP